MVLTITSNSGVLLKERICSPREQILSFKSSPQRGGRWAFIAGRPKASLLFWFFGDFRCGALLFMVIHVIYIYKKKVKIVVNVRLAGDHLYGKLLFTWLSLVMSMMVSFCAVLFPTRCLG